MKGKTYIFSILHTIISLYIY